MHMSKIAKVVLCTIPLFLLGCGPDFDDCLLRNETKCQKARHCRAEMGHRVHEENRCLGPNEMAFCYRPPAFGCINDTGTHIRSPDGTCWIIFDSCFHFPEGWEEDATCAWNGGPEDEPSSYAENYPLCM